MSTPDCVAGVGGLELRNSETLGSGEPSFTLKRCANRNRDIPCRSDWTSAANRASVSSCRCGPFGLVSDPAPLAIPSLWGFGGDGACAVATEKDLKDVASQ